jgi:hypothetical protein
LGQQYSDEFKEQVKQHYAQVGLDAYNESDSVDVATQRAGRSVSDTFSKPNSNEPLPSTTHRSWTKRFRENGVFNPTKAEEYLNQSQSENKETDGEENEISESEVNKDSETLLDELGFEQSKEDNDQKWVYEDAQYGIVMPWKNSIEWIDEEKVHYVLVGYCERQWTVEELKYKTGESRRWVEAVRDAFQKTHSSPAPTAQQFKEKSVDELGEDWLGRKENEFIKDTDLKWIDFLEEFYEDHKNFEQAYYEPLVDKIENNVPDYEVEPFNIQTNEQDYALIVSVYDLHFGKQGWADQTGSGYDTETAKERLKTKTEYILSKVKDRGEPSEVIFLQGGDWLNVDGVDLSTTSGTSVTSEKSYPELMHEANELMVNYIDNLRRLAPVSVVLTPGNHDQEFSYSALNYLSAWYRNEDGVNIVDEHKYKHRLYYKYGNTVIGASHGRDARRSDLDSILMNEAKTLWGESEDTRAVFFVGDKHNSKTVESDETGIPVIQVPCLSGYSTWDHAHGYSSRKALSAYIIDSEKGLDAVEYANV